MGDEEKDKVCQWLLDNLDINSLSEIPASAIEEAGWKYSEFTSIAEYLEREGLLSEVGVNKTVIYMVVLPELRDFMLAGGFRKEKHRRMLSDENLELKNLQLKAQLDMLCQEAERLKETQPAIAERIIHIAASIATILSIGMKE